MSDCVILFSYNSGVLFNVIVSVISLPEALTKKSTALKIWAVPEWFSKGSEEYQAVNFPATLSFVSSLNTQGTLLFARLRLFWYIREKILFHMNHQGVTVRQICLRSSALFFFSPSLSPSVAWAEFVVGSRLWPTYVRWSTPASH